MTKSLNVKDFKIRQNIKQNYENFFLLKSMLLNENNDKKIRFKFMLKLSRIYNDLNHNKMKNRCIFSTKIRSVYRLTNLTKSSFRDNLRQTNIAGFRKAS